MDQIEMDARELAHRCGLQTRLEIVEEHQRQWDSRHRHGAR